MPDEKKLKKDFKVIDVPEGGNIPTIPEEEIPKPEEKNIPEGTRVPIPKEKIIPFLFCFNNMMNNPL